MGRAPHTTRSANEERPMKAGQKQWALLIAAALAGSAHAQTRPVVSGNPLEALPQIKAPDKPNVTVQVEQQAPPLQQLLERHLTPSKIQVEGVKSLPFD